MVTAYAWRTMVDTPHYVDQNPPVTTLTDCAERTGWDTPISGDAMTAHRRRWRNPESGLWGRASVVLPMLTARDIADRIEADNCFGRVVPRQPITTRRRFAVGAVYPMWGDFAHNVTYVNNEGDVFDWYPSDPTSRITYNGRQVTA